MANARVDYDRTTEFGKKIALLCQFGVQYRQYLGELAQQMASFGGDKSAFVAKVGMDPAAGQAFMDQLTRANGELNGTILEGADLPAGSVSFAKTILDRMA